MRTVGVKFEVFTRSPRSLRLLPGVGVWAGVEEDEAPMPPRLGLGAASGSRAEMEMDLET